MEDSALHIKLEKREGKIPRYEAYFCQGQLGLPLGFSLYGKNHIVVNLLSHLPSSHG